MKTLRRIGVSVLIVFLTIGLCYSEAWGLFDKARAVVHFKKGDSYQEKGQWDKAIAEYNKAIELNPEYAEAYYNRGIAYGNKGQYDQAISDYTKAIELNPRYAMAYVTRGSAYRQKGQFDQAISDFNKVIEINPEFAEAYFNRALTYTIKGEYDKAWEDVHKAQSLGFQVHPGFLKDLREASPEKSTGSREACEEDCRKMIEKGELRQGMTVEECIKMLCK